MSRLSVGDESLRAWKLENLERRFKQLNKLRLRRRSSFRTRPGPRADCLPNRAVSFRLRRSSQEVKASRPRGARNRHEARPYTVSLSVSPTRFAHRRRAFGPGLRRAEPDARAPHRADAHADSGAPTAFARRVTDADAGAAADSGDHGAADARRFARAHPRRDRA